MSIPAGDQLIVDMGGRRRARIPTPSRQVTSVKASRSQSEPMTQPEETLRTMAKYQVRRLPVIDGHQLVGIVAQADVARALPNDVVGQVLEEVSEK
jgi:CBS-domain-containing membrane protein